MEALPVIHQQLNSTYVPPKDQDTDQIMIALGFDRLCCPKCSELSMITILTFDRRGPPDGDCLTRIRDKVLQNRRAEIPQA